MSTCLLVTNCDQPVDDLDRKVALNTDLLIRHRDYNFIKDNKALLEKLASFSSNENSSKTAYALKYGGKEDDFIIFTDRVTQVVSQVDSSNTYTFYIERNSGKEFNSIENLVLSIVSNGLYRAHTITYYFPRGIKRGDNNFEVRSFKQIPVGKTSKAFEKNGSNFAKSSGGTCENVQYVIYETLHDCYSGAHSGAGEADQCDGRGSLPYSTYTINYVCSGGGGEGSYDGIIETGDPGSISSPHDDLPVNTGITLPPSSQTTGCDDESTTANQINRLLDEALTEEELIWLFNFRDEADEILASILNNTLISAFPFIKYPPNNMYSRLYPKLTEYLKNLK